MFNINFTTYAIIRCDNVNVKCNKNCIEYCDENREHVVTAFNFGKNCMEQIQNFVPFRRDDSLKELFLQHQKAWTRDFINKWMKKSLLKWSDVKKIEPLQWLNRDWNIEPYSTDVDLFEYWELTTRSDAKKVATTDQKTMARTTLATAVAACRNPNTIPIPQLQVASTLQAQESRLDLMEDLSKGLKKALEELTKL